VKRITAACSLLEFQTRQIAATSVLSCSACSITPPSHLFSINCFLVTPNVVVLTAANSQVCYSEHILELIITSIVSVFNNFSLQVNSAVLLHSEHKYSLTGIKLSPSPLLAALKGIWGGYQECKHGSVAKLHCCLIHSRLSACVNSISSDLCIQKISTFDQYFIAVILARHLTSTEARSTIRCS